MPFLPSLRAHLQADCYVRRTCQPKTYLCVQLDVLPGLLQCGTSTQAAHDLHEGGRLPICEHLRHAGKVVWQHPSKQNTLCSRPDTAAASARIDELLLDHLGNVSWRRTCLHPGHCDLCPPGRIQLRKSFSPHPLPLSPTRTLPIRKTFLGQGKGMHFQNIEGSQPVKHPIVLLLSSERSEKCCVRNTSE